MTALYRNFLRFLLYPLLVLALSAVPALAGPTDLAKKAGLAPHKALYAIQLAGSKSGSQIVNVKGQMLYEWQPSCDAWISNHRFNLYYEYADTPAMRIMSDFSTYEPFDLKSLDFTSQRRRDGELFEELRGYGSLKEDGTGEAVYTLPKGLEFDLPHGAMFPMSHTLNVLQAIKENKPFYNAIVFDGSDDEGPVEINAFIGKRVPPSEMLKSSKELDATLLASPARKVRLAFFPLNDSNEYPDYEMDIVLHENGVISDMYVDYDDFSVTQKLVALEPMGNLCEGQKKK